MKIVVTGSLGSISKPLINQLIETGHEVVVVSRNANKEKDIKAMGAKAAIGTLEDLSFLTDTFTGADAVYLMEPPGDYSNPDFDPVVAVEEIVNNYVQAVLQSKVKHLVHLSSIGAHTNKENGILTMHYNAEKILNKLPQDINILFMRAVGFYYNLQTFIPGIKNKGVIEANYGEGIRIPWVSPYDIAVVIGSEIVKDFKGRKIHYIASDERYTDEIATVLGNAIGKPDLKWKIVSDEQFLNNLLSTGMNLKAAKGFTEMYMGARSGIIYEHYNKSRSELKDNKLEDYAKEFAAVYHQNEN